MIGLIDYDLQTSKSETRLLPNLEIMKLATYYRFEENKFCRLIALDETELASYSVIYVFSEQEIMPVLPPHFYGKPNLIFGGSAFTNGAYIPFENQIIDYTIPKPLIYREFLLQKYNDGVKSKIISRVIDDSFYRMYAGDNRLPIPPIRKNKRIFLYDKEFFYPDWEEIVAEIVARRPSSIIRIHPIVCRTLSQFFSLRQQLKISRENNIILDLNIPLKDVDYMMNKYKKLFLADITPTSKIYLPIGGTFNSVNQYYKDIIYKLNLLYSFWCKNIPIKLKYSPPKIGITDPLETISKRIETWANGATHLDKTILEKIPKPKRKNELHQAQIEINELLTMYPFAKDLFSQNYAILSKGGFWKLW